MFSFEHDKNYIVFTEAGGQFSFQFKSITSSDAIATGLNLNHPDLTQLQIDMTKCVAINELSDSDMERIEHNKKKFVENWDNYTAQQSTQGDRNYL